MIKSHANLLMLSDLKILIRGAGEMATGSACRLYNSGFFRILMTEIEKPLAVRRSVSFCEAVYREKLDGRGRKSRTDKSCRRRSRTLGKEKHSDSGGPDSFMLERLPA